MPIDKAPSNLGELFSDEDFQKSSPETQRWAAQQVDKTFASSDQATQDKLLDGFNKKQQTMDRNVPKVQENIGRSLFNQARDAATHYVANSLETLTAPAVPLARMAQGESPGAAFSQPFRPVTETTPGAGAVEAARNIVPQSPWQVGALAAGGLAGKVLPAAGALTRVLAAGAGGGGAEALTGGNPVGGAAAGMGAQTAGEVIPGLTGFLRRHVGRAGQNVADLEAGNVARAAAGASPTFEGALKPQSTLSSMLGGAAPGQAQRLGQFAVHEAPGAAHTEFQNALGQLDSALSVRGIRINTPELQQAYQYAVRDLRRKPGMGGVLADLAPAHGGWDADQAAQILTKVREGIVGRNPGDTTLGKRQAQTAVENIMDSIEQSLPKDLQGILKGARGNYARNMGLQEILEGGMKESPHGYRPDMKQIQQAASDPEAARRMPNEIGALRQALSRGASSAPGYADMGSRGVPLIPASPTGLKFGLLRQLLTGGHAYAGAKPFTPGVPVRRAVGYAAGQAGNPRE
jgi:hypothetical protein